MIYQKLTQNDSKDKLISKITGAVLLFTGPAIMADLIALKSFFRKVLIVASKTIKVEQQKIGRVKMVKRRL